MIVPDESNQSTMSVQGHPGCHVADSSLPHFCSLSGTRLAPSIPGGARLRQTSYARDAAETGIFFGRGRMATLELTAQEEVYLRELLDSAVSDIRAEIAQTDSPAFKDGLRERKEALMRIARRLETFHGAPST